MPRRKYIVTPLTLNTFFEKLNALSIRYVVLRWFKNLELLSSQGDLDLLVADEDITLINAFLTHDQTVGSIMVDVYSISGFTGSDYIKIPYYPKSLAVKILNSRILHNEL